MQFIQKANVAVAIAIATFKAGLVELAHRQRCQDDKNAILVDAIGQKCRSSLLHDSQLGLSIVVSRRSLGQC